VRESWYVLNPDLPFEHVFLSTYYEDSFEGDKTSEMTGALGIRRVLGASVPGIIRMLVKEFLKLVVIANIIALPISYFLMNQMIHFMFSYPVTIGADIFVVTALVTLLVAFITVTSQTLKAAQASPAQSLKYE
jgi:putative ABC transport system permease protein